LSLFSPHLELPNAAESFCTQGPTDWVAPQELCPKQGASEEESTGYRLPQATGLLNRRAAKSISDKLLGAKSFVRLAVTSISRTRTDGERVKTRR